MWPEFMPAPRRIQPKAFDHALFSGKGMTWLAQIHHVPCSSACSQNAIGSFRKIGCFQPLASPYFLSSWPGLWRLGCGLAAFDYTQRETGLVAWGRFCAARFPILAWRSWPILGRSRKRAALFNTPHRRNVVVARHSRAGPSKPIARRPRVIIPPQIGAIDKLRRSGPSRHAKS